MGHSVNPDGGTLNVIFGNWTSVSKHGDASGNV